MSLPYLPGIGDTLAEHLPKIGQNIAHIINPYREQEDMFKKLIATKPELMDQFAQREQDSPGALSGIFGKKVSDFVRAQPVSEEYKVARAREKSALTGSDLGNRLSKIGISQKTLDYMQDKDLYDFIQTNPNVKTAYNYMKTTGTTSGEELDNKLKVAANIRDRAQLAEQYKTTPGAQIARDYKANKIDTETMQGIFENNPAAMSAAFAILDDETRGRLQRDLHNLSKGDQDDYFRNLQWRDALKEAHDLGIDNPNAYAEIRYGQQIDGFRKATDEEIADARGRLDAVRNTMVQKEDEGRRKENQGIFAGIQSNIKSLSGPSSMGMDDYQRSAIEASVNSGLLELAKNLGGGPGKEYEFPPQFKRVPGKFYGNNGAWYSGNKKISESDFSAYMDRLVKDIAGQTSASPPPSKPASGPPALPPPAPTTATDTTGRRPITAPGAGRKKRDNPY